MSRKTKKIRIPLRVEAMRCAGAWFLVELNKAPHLKAMLMEDSFRFFASLSQRSGAFVEVDVEFARRFICAWKSVLPDHYFLQLRPCSGIPVDGLHAVAEIIVDMKLGLNKGKGRPDSVDPAEAYELNERFKANRLRGSSEYSHERVAEHFGITSKGVVSEKIRQGRAFIEFIKANTEYSK